MLMDNRAQVRVSYRDTGPVADGRRGAGTSRGERNIGDAQPAGEHPRRGGARSHPASTRTPVGTATSTVPARRSRLATTWARLTTRRCSA